MDSKDGRLQFATQMEEGRVEQNEFLNEKEPFPISPASTGSMLVSRPSFPIRGQHGESFSLWRS